MAPGEFSVTQSDEIDIDLDLRLYLMMISIFPGIAEKLGGRQRGRKTYKPCQAREWQNLAYVTHFLQDCDTVQNRQQQQGLDSKGDTSISELLFIDVHDNEC